ncbi:aromatic ring-hydroxylating dioxygenase subunit alpha [Comamonas sp. Y6]|uniref:Aromatic ring-hydroxylating dioxygenase subunit alpha n=1 Tax=Comamonas resistens TaxID=3046670 RepID=A0ABY8SRR9_9BURK|nr:aromatic ring-hydroxylating dioxygenase subunit alpha [Comamonas resistens]MDL5035777.1 aromatic ring-hydroxylating dioxygenase subunit alpha [Comamonas resistens]WHS65191.1 aromatic ring-hydroxylating dioxygenase subunit alpha [Comamonas resistens]HBP0979023.1 aromatic ring-hydroxylating dioxygenase subunit alpha [Pseudomonas aeruginosa]
MRKSTQMDILCQLESLHKKGRDQEMLGKVVQLPVSIYTDAEILDREMASVFRHHPMLAGHVSSVREPGSYLLSDWSSFPYVIVRGTDGHLRAFLNTCRHRGARIVSGKEPCLKAFICPFHGWTYGLDGRLKGITKSYNFPDIDRDNFALVELPVVERAGLIWIHPTPGGKIDLDNALGPIGDDLDHFALGELISYRKNSVIKHANWKLLIKTYLEGYHVPYLHRETLSHAFRKGVIAHYEHGHHIRLSAARTNFLDMLSVPLADRNILDYASVYYSIFPQAFFIMHPDYVSINMFFPLAANRTIWTHEMLYKSSEFQGEAGQKALEKRFNYTNDAVFDQEDFAVAEDVQLGLQHGGNDVHTLGLEEGLLAIFQQGIDQAMSASPKSKQTVRQFA